MNNARNSVVSVILLTSLLISSSTLTRGHEWGDDWASYVMQAQSILNGNTDEFVQRNTFTIFQSSFQIGPIAYPWGYPLILTPALLLKGVHALTLKIPGLLLFIGFLICLHQLTKDRLTRTESLLLLSIFAFNPILIKFTDQILSDLPFLFFVFLGLVLIERPKPKTWNNFFLGFIIFFAAFIRTTGIILLAAYLAHQGLRFLRERMERKEIISASLQVTLTFAVLWLLSNSIFPNGQGAYFKQLMGLTPEIFQGNITLYYSLFAYFFGPEPFWQIVHPVMVVIFLAGAYTRRRMDQPLLVFFILYWLAMIFWPERQGIRFIFPLLPLYVYFIFQGIKAGIGLIPESHRPLISALHNGIWLLIIALFLFTSGLRAYTNLKEDRKINGPFDPYSSDVYNFIKSETPPDSVIVFWKPRAMRLFTGHDTLMLTECEALPKGNYIVISKKAENSQVPPDQIDKCGLSLRNVFENQRFIIYELPK